MKFVVVLCLLCTAASFTTGSKCDSLWTEFGDSCYYVSQYQGYTYHEASSLCEYSGGHLVAIDNAEENMFLKEFVCDTYPLWIGLTDLARENHFEWDNGQETTYRNWNSGEPDNDRQSEHCVHLSTNVAGKWNDAECSENIGYICEKGDDLSCHSNPVGIETGQIANSQMTASSTYSPQTSGYQPERGRLNLAKSGAHSWCSGQNAAGQWLQVDLVQPRKVTKVATQGRGDADQWVTSYKLNYGDGSSWKTVTEANGNAKVFRGNSDRSTIMYHALNDKSFTARYVRFVVVSWYRHISMRVEIYAC
ncbi:EGF-like repeat and discoidin I-like domain-containing protein 3 [Glandiceps talaboti]